MNDMTGQVLSSRFKIDNLIGEGQMGVVYAATDVVLERTVAVKILKEDLASDEQFLMRFQREAKIVAQLSSNPHVVTIYDIGKTDAGLPYLVTEYLSGHPLIDELSGPHKPSRSWVLDVGIQISSVLSDAHSKGVFHRDLKPANVFVMKHEVLPLLIKVLDFGLARSETHPLPPEHASSPGVILGNIKHMAPEVLASKGAQPASDIYALGIMLYEMGTGSPPYDATTAGEYLHGHLVQAPKPFPTEAVPFPRPFQDLVLQMLEKTPSKRPDAKECLRKLWRIQTELDQQKLK
jgi:serine/threonine-protein kinase